MISGSVRLKGAPRAYLAQLLQKTQLALVNRSHFLQLRVHLLAGGLGIQALEVLGLMLSIKLLVCLLKVGERQNSLGFEISQRSGILVLDPVLMDS